MFKLLWFVIIVVITIQVFFFYEVHCVQAIFTLSSLVIVTVAKFMTIIPT